MGQDILVYWISGAHPLKGCLYMDEDGCVSTETGQWTSYHAYPRTPHVIATRVQGVRSWQDADGKTVESRPLESGVWQVEGSYTYLEAVTF